MAEKKEDTPRPDHREKRLDDAKTLSRISYYALKSKNEVYFQMASIFKLVTRNKPLLETRWMESILISSCSETPGKFQSNNIPYTRISPKT